PTPQRVDRQGPGWNKGIKPKEREMGSAQEQRHLARNLADSCLQHLLLTYAGFTNVQARNRSSCTDDAAAIEASVQ
ncbi:hypothetical protein, partial [Mesorhizobium tamadayense]|uniref:hypothetical protein n=1 Tax=Mesorhizobium tamadayense TaxID=425306 RepID=UPI00198032D9